MEELEPPGKARLEQEGDPVGPSILRQRIDGGGFGIVWMAEQSEPISRMIALNLLRNRFSDPGFPGRLLAGVRGTRDCPATIRAGGLSFVKGYVTSGRDEPKEVSLQTSSVWRPRATKGGDPQGPEANTARWSCLPVHRLLKFD